MSMDSKLPRKYVENCGEVKGFDFIYIYIYIDRLGGKLIFLFASCFFFSCDVAWEKSNYMVYNAKRPYIVS